MSPSRPGHRQSRTLPGRAMGRRDSRRSITCAGASSKPLDIDWSAHWIARVEPQEQTPSHIGRVTHNCHRTMLSSRNVEFDKLAWWSSTRARFRAAALSLDEEGDPPILITPPNPTSCDDRTPIPRTLRSHCTGSRHQRPRQLPADARPSPPLVATSVQRSLDFVRKQVLPEPSLHRLSRHERAITPNAQQRPPGP